ncbi:putative surface protein with fasciclin (FAS1) repeats [Sphingobacterium allocomposti]|uniref:Putative surface protein with fasciclin (FAS1) repeats n=2 Tax=Sphingobacterium allocomposti TaxID=415956 RepID=A0A5S5DR70_9SPHI|nr:putative surface protein with fasciclin (FAS1) repeats [Sphingobacterium composti Yoo et al. 2007 non Ten et al. 2007]
MKAKKIYHMTGLLLLAAVLWLPFSCTKENFTETTDTRPNINRFLAEHEDYSLFAEAIKLAGASSYLDAWGAYTVFAPNNSAMQTFLQSEGKSSISDLAEADVKDLVNLHIVQDTVSTGQFRDGKIQRNSVFGMFITTAVQNIEGESYFVLNKESKIIMPNIRTGNGLIHGIDKVFTKVTNTVMQEIEADPNLSLFAEALQLTGLDAVLNQRVAEQYFSVLAVSNATFAQRGFNTIQDLVEKYNHTGNPKNPEDSLYMHIAYHILPDLKYVSDLAFSSSHTTKVPREVLLVKVDRERILLNEEVWLGELEEGAEVDRQASDNTTVNGVLHYIKDDIYIKQRQPFRVDWDPADQPELRVAGVYRRGTLSIPKGYFRDMSWGGGDGEQLWYNGTASGNMAGAAFGDVLEVRMRTAWIPWIEFKTPVVVRGRYKVWVGWRTISNNGRGNTIDTYINGVKLSRSIANQEYRIRDLPERELESLGYKKHLTHNSNNYNCKMVGVVDIEITDRQTLRFETSTNQNANFLIDFIQFIPIDQEQIYPQFDTEGNAVYP